MEPRAEEAYVAALLRSDRPPTSSACLVRTRRLTVGYALSIDLLTLATDPVAVRVQAVGVAPAHLNVLGRNVTTVQSIAWQIG